MKRTTGPLALIAAPTARKRLFLWAWLAFAASVASLAGWPIGAPALSGFGFAAYPNWPWTGIAFALVALGLIVQQAGAVRPAWLALVAAEAIGAIALLEYCGFDATGFDRWLFPHAVAAIATPTPGRPALIPALSVLLTATIVMMLPRSSRRVSRIVLVAGVLVVGLNLMSVTLLLLGSDLLGQNIRIASSLPAAAAALLLALAAFEWLSERAMLNLFRRGSIEWRTTRLVLPAVVALPAILVPILSHAELTGALPQLATEVLASSAYLLLVTAMLVWSLSQIAREHERLGMLSGALDAAPVIILDSGDRIIHWSAGCETLLGWTRAQAIGQRLDFQLGISAADRASLHPAADGPPVLRDLEVRRADGTNVAIRAQTAPMSGRIAIALTDVSSLRHAQAELEASEEKLQIALEAHQIGIFDSDLITDRVTWTLHAAIHHGFPPRTPMTAERWRGVIHPVDLEAIEVRRDEAIAQRSSQYSFSYRTCPPEGDPRMIEGSTRLFYDETGRPIRALGVTVDVTEREDRAVALEVREAQLRSIVATVPDAMLVADGKGLIRNASPTAERMFAADHDEMIGRPLAHYLLNRSPAGQTVEAGFQPDAPSSALGRSRNLIGRRANGEEFPIELFVAKTASAHDTEFVAFVRDLSDRVAEQARIDALNNEYAHFARLTAVGAMAATLAHELNQPLAACSNYLATARLIAKRDGGSEQITEMLRQAGDQILRAGEIIRRTREFVGKNEGDVSVEALDPLIREAVTLGMTGNQRLAIVTRFEFDEKIAEVVVDRIQIQQVIVNLVRNAAEALRVKRAGDREIHISTTAIDDETVEVTVHDNGPGIPSMLLETIGQAFQSTKGEAGMGLGLSICKRIVEGHGGSFTARNGEEGGACFAFTLPSWSEPQLTEVRA